MEYKKISQDEFDLIYNKHQAWLRDPNIGERADYSDTDISQFMSLNINLRGANLRGVGLRGAGLYRAYLVEADLEEADLEEAYLARADLRGAHLRGADLRGAGLREADLREADLREASLVGADLRETDLREADLRGADLRGADLRETDLREADLREADLREASLVGVNLTGVDLGGADLRGANLTNANLHVTNFEGANLEGTILEEYTNTQSIKNTGHNLQRKLNQLAAEKAKSDKELERINQELQKSKDDKDQDQRRLELEKEEIEKKNIEKENKIKQLEKEKEDLITQGKDIEGGLQNAFNNLEEAKKNLNEDFSRLYKLFWGFVFGLITLALLLLILWICAFVKYSDGMKSDFNPLSLWIYISPSLILVSFIAVCITQINKMQNRIVALRKYSRKYEIVKIGLEGYYEVEYKLNKTPEKAQQVFSKMIEIELNREVDTDYEEEVTNKLDSKEKIPIKESVDYVADMVSKVK